eukprot:2579271-Alexandrium_andersonii.AAC.1
MVHGPACGDAVGPALAVEHTPTHQPAAHLTWRERLEAQRALRGLEDRVAPSCPDLPAGTPWLPQCVQCAGPSPLGSPCLLYTSDAADDM